MSARPTQNSHGARLPNTPRNMMVIGALGGKYVRKYAMACGSPVSALMKKSGKIVRIIITLENELASFAVGETAPIATQNAVNKTYTFTGLRNYVLNIIKNQGGIATEDDIRFTITPVDVTNYTYQQSYYYGTTSTVTKISPMVSRPAIVRLLLDKARIKMTYSKQIVD